MIQGWHVLLVPLAKFGLFFRKSVPAHRAGVVAVQPFLDTSSAIPVFARKLQHLGACLVAVHTYVALFLGLILLDPGRRQLVYYSLLDAPLARLRLRSWSGDRYRRRRTSTVPPKRISERQRGLAGNISLLPAADTLQRHRW